MEQEFLVGQRVKILPIKESGLIVEKSPSRDPNKMLYKVRRDSDRVLHFCWDFEMERDHNVDNYYNSVV